MKSLTAYLEECLNYELSKIDESLSVFDGCELDKVIAKQIVRALDYFKSQNESVLVGDVVNILRE